MKKNSYFKGQEGVLLNEIEQIVERWKGCFYRLLNTRNKEG